MACCCQVLFVASPTKYVSNIFPHVLLFLFKVTECAWLALALHYIWIYHVTAMLPQPIFSKAGKSNIFNAPLNPSQSNKWAKLGKASMSKMMEVLISVTGGFYVFLGKLLHLGKTHPLFLSFQPPFSKRCPPINPLFPTYSFVLPKCRPEPRSQKAPVVVCKRRCRSAWIVKAWELDRCHGKRVGQVLSQSCSCGGHCCWCRVLAGRKSGDGTYV